MSPPTAETAPPPDSEQKTDGALESLPPEFVNIQPGGGRVMSLELAWGGVRRAYLRTFRGGYLKRMEACRKGTRNPAPHPILDPRDAKFYENQPDGYRWDEADDPFTWRNRVGFARWGLAELLIFSAMW
ncbi:MAG: phosphatidylserine decarboxylase family protein, partial [Planctomycetota bacterium]